MERKALIYIIMLYVSQSKIIFEKKFASHSKKIKINVENIVFKVNKWWSYCFYSTEPYILHTNYLEYSPEEIWTTRTKLFFLGSCFHMPSKSGLQPCSYWLILGTTAIAFINQNPCCTLPMLLSHILKYYYNFMYSSQF